jgi:type IV pilus assembly protein PilM
MFFNSAKIMFFSCQTSVRPCLFMDKSIVTGIDIGHHSIKTVSVKAAGKRFTLLDQHEFANAQILYSENHMLDYQGALAMLKQVKKTLPRFNNDVALAVPDTAVISRVLNIDTCLEEGEREFAIAQAFSHQSPIPAEELILDYTQLRDHSVDASACLTYQVHATRHEIVESRVLAAKAAGLNPILMDIQGYCQLQVWQLAKEKYEISSNWLLVDIGSTQTLLCSGFDKLTPFHKDISFGLGQMDGVTDMERVDKYYQGLAQRLQRQIQLYASVNPEQKVQGVWLCGGGSLAPGLPVYLADKLRIKCERLNPLSLLKGKPQVRKPENDASLFSLATGLAVRGALWRGDVDAA